MRIDIPYADDLARAWLAAAADTEDQPVIDRAFQALRGHPGARADVVAWTVEAYADEVADG